MTQITRRALLAGATATIAASTAPRRAHAAAAARLIDARWRQFGGGSGPDHGAWDRILGQHRRLGSDGIARFDYAAADKATVAGYVQTLVAADPATMTATAAFCYWANLYNAVTVNLVLDAYPVSSIRKIGGGLLNRGPWRSKIVRVAGAELSLDDIEHGILRPVWRDPRVHYAVNCAALGCPNLSARAFIPGRLAAQLDAGARTYVNHPRGAQVTNGRLVASSIYDWFQADFGGSDAGVLTHLRQHADAPLADALQGVTRIAEHRYDWGLNG